MNSIVARAVVITAIISLVIGFLGGYQWKNLNAEEVTTPTTGTTSLSADDKFAIATENDIKQAVNNGINTTIDQVGADSFFAETTAITYNSSLPTATANWLKPLITPAQAQTDSVPTCSASQAGQVVNNILPQIRDILQVKNPFSNCLHLISINGSLSYTYRTVKGVAYIYDWTFTGTMSILKSVSDGKGGCKDSEIKKQINLSDSVVKLSTKSTATKVICKGTTSLVNTWDNPGYNRSQCCPKDIADIGTPTPATDNTAL